MGNRSESVHASGYAKRGMQPAKRLVHVRCVTKVCNEGFVASQRQPASLATEVWKEVCTNVRRGPVTRPLKNHCHMKITPRHRFSPSPGRRHGAHPPVGRRHTAQTSTNGPEPVFFFRRSVFHVRRVLQEHMDNLGLVWLILGRLSWWPWGVGMSFPQPRSE